MTHDHYDSEARDEAPISRKELIEAIEQVARQYGANGNHDSDLICDAMIALAKALR